MKGVFRKDGTLRRGSTKCLHDSEPLHWEAIAGFRVRHVYADDDIYRARCPKQQ